MPEDYISLLEAAPRFPSRPHKNSVIRWANRGIYGVKLRTVRFGGKRLTRPEWIEDFNRAVLRASPDVCADSPEENPSQQRAEAKLDAMGIV